MLAESGHRDSVYGSIGQIALDGFGRYARLVVNTPRPGIYRVIAPWEYRHLRFFGVADIADGGVTAAAGFSCLAYGAYGRAAFFLVFGALALAGGGWFLTINRSAPART